MPRKPNQKVEEVTVDQLIDSVDVSSSVGAVKTESKPIANLNVSIDLSKRTFFGLPSGKMRLGPKNFTCVIPSDLNTEEEMMVRNLIDTGELVLNCKDYIPPFTRSDDVLKEYFDFIKQYGLDPANQKSPSIIKFKNLVRMSIDRNWSAKEILRYCIEQETKLKNREKVIKTLKNTLFNSNAPDSLLEI